MRKLRPRLVRSGARRTFRGFGRLLRDPLRGLSLGSEGPGEASEVGDPDSFAHLVGAVQDLPSSSEGTPQAEPPTAEEASRRPPAAGPLDSPQRLWVCEQGGRLTAIAPGAPAGLLERLVSGRELPRRQLDLHRLGVARAREVLSQFVAQTRRQGVHSVLVVCGRGLHSGGRGPVLPEVVVEALAVELAGQVLAFCTAPRRFGGPGALLVRLRPKARVG